MVCDGYRPKWGGGGDSLTTFRANGAHSGMRYGTARVGFSAGMV